jgi:hypothetical protein
MHLQFQALTFLLASWLNRSAGAQSEISKNRISEKMSDMMEAS